MKCLFLLFTLTLSAHASAEGMLIDLGDRGTNTGYVKQSEPFADGAYKVQAYDWVCPPGYDRPTDGRVVIWIDEVQQQVIELGPRQCFNYATRHIADMIKQYRSAYYVVGGKTEDLAEGQQDHGGSGAAAAANAAGAAAGGIYSSCTSNPFALCSGPRPGRKNPLRACFDFICPFGR
ncbi:MAG: hypothetical protein AB1768_17795 [Pseudomonadota bacterium]|jgi:hypothetical protein